MARRSIVVLFLAACGHPGGTTADAPAPTIDAASAPIDAAPLPAQTARLRIVSRCDAPIWIAHSSNLAGDQDVALAKGAYHDYDLPAAGIASVRFWPKLGCDASGHACAVGDNGEGGGAPCGATGCEPPFDSKFEATFAASASSDATWYDLSLVDGYTLPLAVKPIGLGTGAGTCVASDCSTLDLAACPAQDQDGLDLRVRDASGATIACLSPCKAWNYPAPYGEGKPESQDPGLHLCCPTPIDPASGNCTIANACMTPDACRDPADPDSVTRTSYVALIHDRCPSAYSYAYDDAGGLHDCPSTTLFEVTFCP